MDKKKSTAKKQPVRLRYVHAVLEADMKDNPMPRDAADSILKIIIAFFFSNRSSKR